ncbi:disulfide bond formation protein DsbB [Aestuariibacter salexigens]|uniref:disulfide bond formation protein DsbB n=1 Tax=Aestuariibacter salexigens TaxID=226010 RepID=UPI000423FD8A|nr:disulfide bond formation protein DsbB [Aestuariibacter salexigens]
MKVFTSIGQWPEQSWSWLLLFLSSLALVLTALYFQYSMGLEPCIMCIYQRVATIAIGVAALLPLFSNNTITRLLAFIGWGVSAIWGFFIAREHVDMLGASNPFFVTCDIVPNFPDWLLLHEWLPSMFAATGDCGEIDWVFAGLAMPEWMVVVFAIYSVLFISVLGARLLSAKKL